MPTQIAFFVPVSRSRFVIGIYFSKKHQEERGHFQRFKMPLFNFHFVKTRLAALAALPEMECKL
jgi:hypothetical protein